MSLEELRKWLPTATIEELDAYLLEYGHDAFVDRFVSNERTKRHFNFSEEQQERRFRILSKIVTPGFIVGFLAMVFAGISAWPVVREWLAKPVQSPTPSVGVQSTQTKETPLQAPASSQPSASISVPEATPSDSVSIPKQSGSTQEEK